VERNEESPLIVNYLEMIKRLFVVSLFFLQLSLSSQNIDIRLLRSINSPEPLSSDKFFKLMSDSNPYLVAGIPAGMALTGLVRHDDKLFRNACVSMASVVVNSGITLAIKYSVNRDRPFVTYPDIMKKSKAGSPSFPSGHTSGSFALATSLSLTYPKWYVIVPTWSWAGTVAYSRMHLGVHYPSDVLAGAVIGAGSAWLTYTVNKKLNFNSKTNK
jgi:membrane-associated phospholipid phosphatase